MNPKQDSQIAIITVSKAPEGSLCRMCGSTPAVVSHDIPMHWVSNEWKATDTRRVNDCAACYGEPKAETIFKVLRNSSDTDSADEYRQVLSQAIAALQAVAAEISA